MIIEQIKKNKLYLSTGEIIDISPLIRIRYNLKIGDNINEYYNEIIYDAAVEKGIFLLSLRDRTKKEITLKLKEKYKNIQMIQKAVEKLEDLNYIDDFNYALTYIKNKKYGKQRINFELYQKGINKEIIENAYNYLDEEENNGEKSIEIKKLEIAIKKITNKDEKKLIQYLLRQGFEFSKIIEKLKEYKEYGEFCE